MKNTQWLWIVAPLVLTTFAHAAARPPSRAEVEAEMGLKSQGDRVRGQLDTVGFVVDAEQARDVVTAAVGLEGPRIEAADRELGLEGGLVGAVCPHDDHLYAARVYVHISERITAPRVVLLGVFHKARLWDLEDRLVFDAFDSWHGPWGPVAVDPLRLELLGALDPGAVVVDNAMHCREHSLEAIVPFLQAVNPEVEIVPILVPYMGWEKLSELSDQLAAALAAAMSRHDWQLGRDLALVISADLVHYGGDFDHAPFGADAAAYERAVARDTGLLETKLARPLSAEAHRELLYTLVEEGDVRSYRLPWCGRFSIPFGLETLRKLAVASGLKTPEGTLFRYGTSLSEPELPVSPATRAAGLGYTAPSNLHHWVGYGAVGYVIPD